MIPHDLEAIGDPRRVVQDSEGPIFRRATRGKVAPVTGEALLGQLISMKVAERA
jgi:hypothetical protein